MPYSGLSNKERQCGIKSCLKQVDSSSQQCDLKVTKWSEEVAKLENSEVSEVHTVNRLSYQVHVQVLN